MINELSYIAGFCDGEATFSVGKFVPSKPGIRVIITNTQISVLHYISDFLGYGVFAVASNAAHPRWLPQQRLQFVSGRARQISWTLLPFLRLKRRCAELIAFYPMCPKQECRNTDSKNAINALRVPIHDEIRLLNVRGQARNTKEIARLQAVSPIPPGIGEEWVRRGYTHLTVDGPKRNDRTGVLRIGPNTNDPPISAPMRKDLVAFLNRRNRNATT